MPLNPFWAANQSILMPVIIVQMLKWQAANAVEKEGKADERSYMYRAGYYDLLLIVCYVCFGKSIDARTILELYGETYAEYAEEFSNA